MKKFLKSFGYAAQGVKWGLRERNMRIHLLAAGVVLLMGYYFSLSLAEWTALFLAIGLVVSMELMNSALEELTTLLTEHRPQTYARAGLPKDLAAGAVLVSALMAAAVGVVVFLPHILSRWML